MTEAAEDRLIRMMADQHEEFVQFKKNIAERLATLERRPRRSVNFLGGDYVSEFFSVALFLGAALILVRVIVAALAKAKTEGGSRVNPSLSKA